MCLRRLRVVLRVLDESMIYILLSVLGHKNLSGLWWYGSLASLRYMTFTVSKLKYILCI